MLSVVRRRAVRHWAIVVAATTLVAVPTAADAAPAAPTAAAAVPAQEPEATESGDEAATRAVAQVQEPETLAQADPATVASAIEAVNENVFDQLEQLRGAQGVVDTALAALAEADAAVQNAELSIEELTAQSDEVVIDAFINPPAESALDVFESDTIYDATIKQAILDMRADESAGVLTRLAEERSAFEDHQAEQEQRRQEADTARADAEAAYADLESAVSQQTQFVLEVQQGLDAAAAAATTPEEAAAIEARRAALQSELDQVQEERAAAEAAAEAERLRRAAEERAVAEGIFICPVAGPMNFTDTWGAARSGGRTHQGTDMMADIGVPTVAPASGEVEHRGTSLGGMSWYVYGDDGHTYYGTHLSAYENVGVGHVSAGTVIGYVGDSGNAAGIPHLHFEYHPNGGSAVNPYPALDRACPDH